MEIHEEEGSVRLTVSLDFFVCSGKENVPPCALKHSSAGGRKRSAFLVQRGREGYKGEYSSGTSLGHNLL